jgi:hypothetical protein
MEMRAGITQLPGLGSYPCDRLRMFCFMARTLPGRKRQRRSKFLYGHDLFFFCLEVFLYQRDMFIGNILDLFFCIFGFVFAEAVLL